MESLHLPLGNYRLCEKMTFDVIAASFAFIYTLLDEINVLTVFVGSSYSTKLSDLLETFATRNHA